MNEHRRARDLLGPYVLGALEPEEERQVREHLRRCEGCRAEESGLRETHESLSSFASTAEEPPPDLKNRVLAGVPRRRTRRISLLAAAALISLAVAALLYLPGTFTRETVAQASLEATELAPRAGGELKVERNEPNARATLEVWNLPRPERDEYYELWFGRGEGRISAGTFVVDAEGRGTLDMTVPETVGDYQRVGITLEEFPEEPRMEDAKVVLGGELRES